MSSITYQISKEFHFSAAHRLLHLDTHHPCYRPHGHNYIVVFVLEGPLSRDENWIRDFGELDDLKAWLDGNWDHRDLNEWFRGELKKRRDPWSELDAARMTTAESMASFLLGYWGTSFPDLVEVRISETPKTWASARRSLG